MLLQRLHSEKGELMWKIAEGQWDDSIESELGDAIADAIDDFGPDFDAEGNPIEEGESDRILREEERGGDGAGAEREAAAEEAEESAEASAEAREEEATTA
jgi:F-type H+/Na+-transporting ATPase subunit alpha